MGMYSEKVMDHFAHPRNVGEMPDANGVGEVGNAKCGDIMRMYLKIEDGRIVDVKFMTFGCGGGHRHQQHGHRADQGPHHRGSPGPDQQGRCGGAGRSAAGQGALQRAGRAGREGRSERLLPAARG